MSRRPARSLRLAALPLVAVVALGGCGGGGSDGDEPDASSSSSSSPSSSADAAPTAAEQTVRDWLTATVEGDVAACDLETAAFRRTANEASRANLSPDGSPLSCEQRIRLSASALEDIGGDDYADTIAAAEIVTLDEGDGTASVEVTYNEASAPTTFTVVEDGDAWLIDGNSALVAPEASPTDAQTEDAG